jgi:DsbC/DsbD-like thiol-disulfide interchange protein
MEPNMRMRIALMGLLALMASIARGASGNDLVQCTLLADTTAAVPGHSFKIGVLLKIAPQWHIYWINPGDAGMPTSIDLQLPPGCTASPWQYPVPTRIEQPGGIVSFGYEDEVMLIATITPPKDSISADVTIAAKAKWLVCEKICLPGEQQLSLTLPLRNSTQTDHEDQFRFFSSRMPTDLHAGDDITASSEKISGNQLTIAIEWKNDVPTNVQWFPPAVDAVSFSNVGIKTNQKITTITANLEFLPAQPIPTGVSLSVVGYTVANDRRGTIVPIDFRALAQR